MSTRTSSLNLVTVKEPNSAAAEAYRRLRTNLEFAALTGKIETLVVAAPGPGEGATITAANLAVVLAQANKRVILVDADLRHPSLHTIFGLPLEPGLTDMMRRPELLDEPPLQPTGVEGLWVLTSGGTPPNPAELIASPQMRAIIEALRERADMVIFDAPPVVPVTDASVLATRTDGVLLVLRAGKTRREQAARARELLDQVQARIVGSVLTDVDVDVDVSEY
ncbi:hypothetical protein ARMA_0755 [Ardenticatena maritima]|uniref:Uncharacterized protein n=1 Tax=Ardenticatena maritima TaxID=872965 RepID=A0A0M8K7I7_9CHLR|nr:CpsD/CapB family tyrosine-protein kinase [Ardenticatena maritima]KPL87304.1 hypothetical protein SE16_12520 [Ardenticatena maritima]GAP62332.1 hypothetical protein ARMA_0755 [Ardenticatena maritima]